MTTIVTRAGKGSPLTNTEVDSNFSNLNSDKQEVLTEGAFVDGDKTKLDGIESGATADQTAQEIATAIDADATAEATLKSALGLGTAAYTASTDYATAAQGALADSATQPGDNVSDLTNDAGYTTNAGTVTSVAATVPTGFAISGSPITSSGTLAVSFDTGYALPTSASQSNWDTAYGWGDHASAGYLTGITGQSIKNLSDVYSSMTPTDGQVLTYDTTNGWQAEDASGGGGGITTGKAIAMAIVFGG